MSKKRKKKAKPGDKSAIEIPPSKEDVNDNAVNEKPFDFGGLPERDLKKNLGGCG